MRTSFAVVATSRRSRGRRWPHAASPVPLAVAPAIMAAAMALMTRMALSAAEAAAAIAAVATAASPAVAEKMQDAADAGVAFLATRCAAQVPLLADLAAALESGYAAASRTAYPSGTSFSQLYQFFTIAACVGNSQCGRRKSTSIAPNSSLAPSS